MFHFTLAVEIFSAGCSRSVSLTCFPPFSFPHISVFSCFGRVSFCLLVFWFSTSVAFAWFSFKLFYSLYSCSLFDSFPRFPFGSLRFSCGCGALVLQVANQSAVSQEQVDNILQENDALRTNLAALEQVIKQGNLI